MRVDFEGDLPADSLRLFGNLGVDMSLGGGLEVRCGSSLGGVRSGCLGGGTELQHCTLACRESV